MIPCRTCVFAESCTPNSHFVPHYAKTIYILPKGSRTTTLYYYLLFNLILRMYKVLAFRGIYALFKMYKARKIKVYTFLNTLKSMPKKFIHNHKNGRNGRLMYKIKLYILLYIPTLYISKPKTTVSAISVKTRKLFWQDYASGFSFGKAISRSFNRDL